MGASGAGGAYEIERSLRFNSGDSTKLSRTPSSAGSATTWTFSFWTKKTSIASAVEIFSPYRAPNNQEAQIRFSADDQFQFYGGGGASDCPNIKTTRVFRDTNAWYHIVLAVDTTQGTAADRVNIYVNGVKETAFAIEIYGDQSKALGYMGAQANYIGAYGYDSGGSVFYNGYLAEMHWVDGTQLTAASFGETNEDTGEWVPKEYAGSHGSQGWYLNFSDNSNTTAGTLGADSSANSNNWTPTNFATGDSVIDTPTNNFATLMMVSMPMESGASISDGNLKWVSGSGTSARNQNKQAISNILVNSGKWYAEVRLGTGGTFVGVGPYQVGIGPTQNNNRYAYLFADNGDKYVRTASSEVTGTHGSSYTSGDILGIYLDMDAGTPAVYFSKNGQWADGSGNFDESSPNSAITLGDSFFTEAVGGNDGYCGFQFSSAGSANNCNCVVNFGQDSTFSGQETAGGNTDSASIGDFKYTVPTGAKALCTANLPTPTIENGSDYFNTVTYTANASAGRTLSGIGFSPNLCWFARRNDTSASSGIFDSVRGVGKALNVAYNDPYETEDGVTSFTSPANDGVTLGATWPNARNNDTWVAWSWKGGTAGSGSTTGSGTGKTYTSNYNAPAGFSITRYTGNGTAGHTIPHSLGVTPEMIIIKAEENSGYWAVYHDTVFTSAANPNILYLNVGDAEADDTNVFGTSVTINSSVFSVGDYTGSNTNNEDHIAYCFASVEGYSKVGTYIGNGNADGPFSYTGFKPAWLMIKRTNVGNSWTVSDNKRSPYNPNILQMQPDNTSAEGNAIPHDYTANGFKIRTTGGDANSNGSVYMYLAFAESPFKYANAR